MKINAYADAICKALIKTSNGRWDSSLERTLHRLGHTNNLNPSLVAQVIRRGLHHHQALAVGFFNWAAQQPGFTHNSSSYEALIQCLGRAKQFRAIDKFLKQIRFQRLELTSSAFTTIISTQIQANDSQDAFKTFREMKNLGHKLNTYVCNSLLGSLASDGYTDLAKALYSEMRSDKVPLTAVSFGIFIGLFCRTGDLKTAVGFVDEVKQIQCFPGSIIAALMINGLCRASRIEEARCVLEEMRVRGCKPDFIAYQIVIEALRMIDKFDEAQQVLKQKRKLGVAPNASEYKEFIFALVAARKTKEAREIVSLIRGAGFPVDEDVFNVLIGSISNIDPDAAFSLFQAMIAANLLPTGLTICNLIRGLCNAGKADTIWQVFLDLTHKGFATDTATYNAMVFSLCKGGKIKEAYRILEEMRRNEQCPDVMTYNTLMNACCKADMLRPARRLWDEMFREGCHPNVQTYNILILSFSKIGEVLEAERLLKHMLQKAVVPDTLTYKFLIDGLIKANELDKAYEIFNEFVKSGLAMDVAITNKFVDALCKAGMVDQASKLLGMVGGTGMENGTSTGNFVAHVILLKTLCELGDIKKAVEHVEWVTNSCPLKISSICIELISSLFNAGKTEEIVNLLDTMIERNLVSNCGQQRMLIERLCFDGEIDKVLEIMQNISTKEFSCSVGTLMSQSAGQVSDYVQFA